MEDGHKRTRHAVLEILIGDDPVSKNHRIKCTAYLVTSPAMAMGQFGRKKSERESSTYQY